MNYTPIIFRDTPNIKAALHYLAKKEEVTLSAYVRNLFREDLKKKGLWPIPEDIKEEKEERVIA